MSFEYQTGLYRGGNPLGIDDSQATGISWSRRLDDVSTCEVTYSLPGTDCCRVLGQVEPWADRVGIFRNGRLVWYGWIDDVIYSRDTVRLHAVDALGLLNVRMLSADLILVGVDYSTIFDALLTDALAGFTLSFEGTPTGVLTDKKYLAASYQPAWDIASELLTSAVDAIAMGERIIFGDLSFLGTMELDLNDIEGDVEVRKAGEFYANQWIAKGADDTVALATNPAPAPYPLIQRVTDSENIQNLTDAQAAADSRLALSQIVPRIVSFPQGAGLVVCDDETLSKLVPGKIVNFDPTGLCVSQKQTMRLQGIDVSVSGTEEKVSLMLEPIGATDLGA